jgi:hypothetical protein
MSALHLEHVSSNARLRVTINSLEIVLIPRHSGHSILIVNFLSGESTKSTFIDEHQLRFWSGAKPMHLIGVALFEQLGL